jgi:hypothetical protein
MPASTYLRGEWMKYGFTTTAMGTRPTAWHVSLHTADPGGTGASEVSGSAYARVNATALLTRSGSQVTNSAGAVTFPTVITTPYTVTHAGVWDAATVGNFLFGGALAVAKVLRQSVTQWSSQRTSSCSTSIKGAQP